MKKIAVFPGSFSPFTKGHESIVNSALPLFDQIIIAIGKNSTKKPIFSIEKRKNWIKDIYSNNHKIFVLDYSGLTVDLCKKMEAKFILRGLRNVDDFKFENDIAKINMKLNNDIETVFFIPPAEFSHISSTLVRDIMLNNGDTSNFISFKF